MTGLSCVIYGSRRALPRRCPAMTGLSCVIYPDEHCPGMSSHDWVELCDIWIQTSIAGQEVSSHDCVELCDIWIQTSIAQEVSSHDWVELCHRSRRALPRRCPAMTGLSCVIYGSRRALPRRCPAMTGLSCVIYPDEHCPGDVQP